MALRHLQRLVRAAPLVALASATHCSPENHFEQAVGNLELLEILMARTKTPVPAGLASSIVERHKGDEARVRTLVDQAIARGANADEALLSAYVSRDQAIISHLLVGRTTVPRYSIRYIVSGEYHRWLYRQAAADNVSLFARIREAVALGADPSASTASRGSALAIAVALYNADLVRLLLDLGADPAGVDAHGHTALWIAIDSKQPAIVRMLLDASDARKS